MSLIVDIKKKLGAFSLNVSFEHKEGILALLGASGSGKSMTLKCVAGIDTPDSGTILLNGKTLFDSKRRINLPPQKRHVGYLFQNYALFPNMSARRNIEAGIKLPAKTRKPLVDDILSSLFISEHENKFPGQLSGGQQQRVALARILVSSPEIMLLDEPFSALDSYLKWRLETELADILSLFAKPVVFVSHNRDEVYRLCDRVCVINEGNSEPSISVSRLFDAPPTLSAAILSGCKNFSAAQKIDEYKVYAADWAAELVSVTPVNDNIKYVGVRSHVISPFISGNQNIIKCKVIRVTAEAFSVSLMLLPVAVKHESEYSFIRLELPKQDWLSLDNPPTLDIAINHSDLLLLCS